MKSVHAVVKGAKDLGVKHITLYAFSAQNWKRPKVEVNALMELLKHYLLKEGNKLIENGVRLKAIGRLWELPQDVHKVLSDTIENTKDCNELTLTLALSYGGREEIIDAVKEMISHGNIAPEDINQTNLVLLL